MLNLTLQNLTTPTIQNNTCIIDIEKITHTIEFGLPRTIFWAMLISTILIFIMLNYLINFKEKGWFNTINDITFLTAYLLSIYATYLLWITIYKPTHTTQYILLGCIIIIIGIQAWINRKTLKERIKNFKIKTNIED